MTVKLAARVVTQKAFAAIRRTSDSGKEWIDTDTLAGLPELSRYHAEKSDREIPAWTAANPVLRIAPVLVIETQE